MIGLHVRDSQGAVGSWHVWRTVLGVRWCLTTLLPGSRTIIMIDRWLPQWEGKRQGDPSNPRGTMGDSHSEGSLHEGSYIRYNRPTLPAEITEDVST